MDKQVAFDIREASRRLIKIRTEAGYTQEELADKVNVSLQTIKNYEKAGSTNVRDASSSDRVNAIAGMKIETLFLIAREFNVSADYLLGNGEIRTPDPTTKSIITYTGLSEDSINTLHEMQADIRQNQGRCADIGSNKPYLDWLNDLLDGFYLDEKLIATFYIALRRAVVNGGDWYKNNQNGKTNDCDNISAEYACMKIGREVELLLRRKYRVEKAGAGGGYRRDFDSDVNTED